MIDSGVRARTAGRCAAVGALMAFAALGARAAPVVYDFESLADGATVTNQIAGLAFTDTIALTAGTTLNEIDFPPQSGSKVVSDDGGAISIVFSALASSVGAYFTYVAPLTIAAYDAADLLIGSITSAAGDNLGSPNEFISFADAGGRISRVVITGDLLGGSFTMDDLTVDSLVTVPEPGTAALVLGALALGALPQRRARRHEA